MQCPKCGHEQKDGYSECFKCGIVFSKFAERQTDIKETDVHPEDDFVYIEEKPVGFFKRIFLNADDSNMIVAIGGAVLLVLMIYPTFKILFSTIESNYVGEIFMHRINLVFHEAGHPIFAIFGSRILASAGGMLGQWIIPLILLVYFLIFRRTPFSAAIMLWWFGESMMDIAPYMADARALKLLLLGGVTGQEAAYGYHDFQFIFHQLNIMNYDKSIAAATFFLGRFFMVLSLVWAWAVVVLQIKNAKADKF